MSLYLVTAPTEEPVTTEQAKEHLRLNEEMAVFDETYLENLIISARKYVENWLQRKLVTQTWDLYMDSFPSESYIEIPFPPLQSVSSLIYKDTDGTLTTWDAANYIVDSRSQPGRISLAYGISWPSTYAEIQSVRIQFVCGYGLAVSVPDNIKTAMLMKIADLYQNRGESTAEQLATVSLVDRAIESIMWSDRITPI